MQTRQISGTTLNRLDPVGVASPPDHQVIEMGNLVGTSARNARAESHLPRPGRARASESVTPRQAPPARAFTTLPIARNEPAPPESVRAGVPVANYGRVSGAIKYCCRVPTVCTERPHIFTVMFGLTVLGILGTIAYGVTDCVMHKSMCDGPPGDLSSFSESVASTFPTLP